MQLHLYLECALPSHCLFLHWCQHKLRSPSISPTDMQFGVRFPVLLRWPTQLHQQLASWKLRLYKILNSLSLGRGIITSVIWQHRFESYLLSWFDEPISQSYIFQESSIVRSFIFFSIIGGGWQTSHRAWIGNRTWLKIYIRKIYLQLHYKQYKYC